MPVLYALAAIGIAVKLEKLVYLGINFGLVFTGAVLGRRVYGAFCRRRCVNCWKRVADKQQGKRLETA